MTEPKMKYFVLKPKGRDGYARASRAAMLCYADYIDHENQELADALRAWVNDEQAIAVQEHAAEEAENG